MNAKILIADDESDIVSMLGSFFERVCNTLCYSWSPFSSAAFFIFSSICRSSSLRR